MAHSKVTTYASAFHDYMMGTGRSKSAEGPGYDSTLKPYNGIPAPQANTGLLGQIGGQLKSQQDAANAANEARYQKLLGLSEQFGMTQRRNNNELTQRELASGQSSLISRGLGNSTVVDSVRQGILRQGQDRKMDINQKVAEIQMGPIERRTDQQPNLGMYASLLGQPGALQGGAGELLGGMFGLKPGKRR